MNLLQNIIDNVLECEVKLGHVSMPISFYYPESTLCQLLNCNKVQLPEATAQFSKETVNSLGGVIIMEVPSEPGRYGLTIPSCGVDYISSHYNASEFTISFITEIKKPNQTLTGMVDFFRSFSEDVIIDKESATEWAISFANDLIDPYVYHIEQNIFGLEYHRFTREAYAKL